MEINRNIQTLLEQRYLRKELDSEVPPVWKVVETPDEMFRRVAQAVAAVEPAATRSYWEERFYHLMTEGIFLPNSPTLMNAGMPLGQLSACFVLPVEDSIEGIFETLKKAAIIFQSGGGVGYNFSSLRPKGAIVRRSQGFASGPLSFMRVFNTASETVEQAGKRRGASMGVLNINHPDIEEFIDAKRPGPNRQLEQFNISVMVFDSFMQAVQDGRPWDLTWGGKVYKTVDAQKLFQQICQRAWESGDPGMLFFDRINRDHPLPGVIDATNPCGEQPLRPYGSCNLGSINLVKCLSQAQTGDFFFDWTKFHQYIYDAVRFLDDVIDINHYPLPEIAEEVKNTRPIGLGIMGFADLLPFLGIRYGSPQSIEMAEHIADFLTDSAREASAQLADVRGNFPLWGESKFAPYEPARNLGVTTIAPTGTISLIAGVSSGIEPHFALAYSRTFGGDPTVYTFVAPQFRRFLEWKGLRDREIEDVVQGLCEGVPLDKLIAPEWAKLYPRAQDLTVDEHLEIQAAFQRYIENAVSKTINMKNSATVADVAQAYLKAWQLGLKGVTIFRDGCLSVQVLNAPVAEDVPDEPPTTRIEESASLPEISEEEVHCPECGAVVHRESGCLSCVCGWSACVIA